jgi:lysophospholipase
MSVPPRGNSGDEPSVLHRLVFPARRSSSRRGTAIIIHGHGDHAARYESVMGPLRDRGITCFVTDQPGHGSSPGRRGAIPGIDAIDALIDQDLARARSLDNATKPILIGHSAGGLLALRELLRHPDTYRAAWISSPLVWPERTRHPAMVALLLLLGRILPNFQVGTGVTESMCRHDIDQSADTASDPLFHNRIILGWAGSLVTIARHVRAEFPARHPDIPILITQGDADPVCHANLLREFLATIDHPSLRYEEFAGVLHEPFADEHSENVFNAVADWLDHL